ncbi:Sugar efflux transporter A [compost metagenome]
MTAVAAGVLFYLGLILFHSREALLALQLFNAIFIGIVAGIGMLWFQDLMPGRAGSATTLFTNSISTGVILAGVIQGALVQSYGHFAVYWVIAAISLLTLALTCRVKDV